MKLLPTFLQKLPEIYEKVLSPTTLTPSSLNTSKRQERSPDNFKKNRVKDLGQRTLDFSSLFLWEGVEDASLNLSQDKLAPRE